MTNRVTSDAINTLNDLIDVCLDGAEGYRTAMQDVTGNNLKTLLHQFSNQRTQFAKELQSEVAHLGGSPERDGTARAALHRGWMNVKSAVGANNDLAILEECERGEDIARDTYDHALRKTGDDALPAATRQIVKAQCDQIRSSHDSIKILRDREKQV